MDAHCYHHGAGLLKGDIEDLGSHRVIVCPWHTYKIDLSTGEGVYVGLDAAALARGAGKESAKEIRSKGVRQRVHPVVVSSHNLAGLKFDGQSDVSGCSCSDDFDPGVDGVGRLKSLYIFVADGAPQQVREQVARNAG